MATNDEAALRLRPAEPSDGPAISRLLAATFPNNPKVKSDVLRWQYWENPAGPAVSWVWEDAGEVISHSARLPVNATFDGEPALCGLAIDGATALTHRRRGLYERLRRALHEDCCARGMRATLLFLGPESMVPRIDVRTSVPLRVFVLPLDGAWLSSRLHLPRFVGRRLVRSIRSAGRGTETAAPPEGLDELWSDLAERFPYSVVKDGQWWSWRYAASPSFDYRFFEVRSGGRLRGAAVTTRRTVWGGGFVLILELLARTDDDARALVKAITHASPDASALALLATPNSLPANLAADAGLRRVPRWFESRPNALGIWNPCADRSDFTKAPWSATWGEADFL